MICFDRSGYFALEHYLRRAGFDMRRPVRKKDAPSRVVYCIVPELAHFEDIPTRWKGWGLSADQLRSFPVVKEFGYYRVRRSETPVPFASP